MPRPGWKTQLSILTSILLPITVPESPLQPWSPNIETPTPGRAESSVPCATPLPRPATRLGITMCMLIPSTRRSPVRWPGLRLFRLRNRISTTCPTKAKRTWDTASGPDLSAFRPMPSLIQKGSDRWPPIPSPAKRMNTPAASLREKFLISSLILPNTKASIRRCSSARKCAPRATT